MQSNKATDAYGLGIRFQTESQDHCIHGLVLAPRNALRNECIVCNLRRRAAKTRNEWFVAKDPWTIIDYALG